MTTDDPSTLLDGDTLDTAYLRRRLRTLEDADLPAARQAVEAAEERRFVARVRNTEDAAAAEREAEEAAARVPKLIEDIAKLQTFLASLEKSDASAAGAKRLDPALKRAVGSRASEYTADIERVAETGQAFLDAIARLNARYPSVISGHAESLFLLHAFPDLERPDLPTVPAPANVREVVDVLMRMRMVTLAAPIALPRQLLSLAYRGRQALRRLIAGTPTEAIIQALGEPDEAAWNREHDARMREQRDKGDAARREEVARCDTWLTEALEAPQPVEAIERAAKEDGMRWRKDNNHPHQSINEAAERLGVVGLQERAAGRDGPVWWGLADAWDRERFGLLAAPRASMAGMR